MGDKYLRYVKLEKSPSGGLGFSIIGGAGSELPPIIHQIVTGSPADLCKQLQPGDVILEVNGLPVETLTTKEVLNCLREAPDQVILKLRTDGSTDEHVQQLLAAASDPVLLQKAIQPEKKLPSKRKVGDTVPGVPPPLPPKAGSPISFSGLESPSATLDRSKKHKSPHSAPRMKNGVLDDSFEEGDEHFQSCFDISVPEKGDESRSAPGFDSSAERQAAVRLAKRLYLLDGFKKTDVSRHLSKNNEFSKAVAEEYLQHFDFKKKTLDEALRAFLERFCLLGETQERERVLVHFSRRYLDCNDGTFNSQDAVHTLTCALMLLNTDLHGAKKSMTRAMTCSEFITNLAELNDGQDFPPQVLRDLHTSIKNKPLKWAGDDEGNAVEGAEDRSDASPLLLGSNPFLAPSAGDGFIYKKGYIMRKCCIDPNGKKTSFGKRSWKMWWCVVQDLAMYLYKDEQCGVRGSTQQPQPGTLAVRLHHALATRAHDYNKKQHVFRLHTADHAVYLLQTSDSKELQAWIDAINFVAASLSAAPMAGAVGSQKKFQRPLLPCSATKLNLRDQTLDHEERLARLEEDLQQHLAKPPDKTAKTNTLANYREKEAYLNEQIKRYRAYVYLLRSKLAADVPPPPVPDLPVFSPGRDPHHDHAGDNGRVVAPPIPQRGGAAPSLPSDRLDASAGRSLNPFEEDVEEAAQEVAASPDAFTRELQKVEKQQEKRVKKVKEQEKKINKKSKEKQQDDAKQNEEGKEKKRETKKRGKCEANGEARVGTMGRLSALFSFNKLNKYGEVEKEEVKVEVENDSPPPLPPKPDPSSPVMRSLGTRLDL
ncbi:PH and SEC7 domain-containing protein isoform X3 [Hyalella azteca]|uniref:PH and SEC7 domain-containing protein isoform X3 n=1 Tax=Hyalella azteca TaxID=294128 RepID=A0A8B7NFL3_HYAAZ|nr:PH and SEC7 domain-containing protein isoform X3 [Hyalella azteca]